METTYTQEQITQAMLFLGFDSDQICNLLNRLETQNGNPDERTSDDKYVDCVVTKRFVPAEEE